MPRLIVLWVLLIAAVVIVWKVVTRAGQGGADGYRPRRRWGWGQKGDAGLNHLVRRSELDGVRDAYSSAPLDTTAPLFRCSHCLVFYNASSREALAGSNDGRCIACGHADLGTVRLLDE